MNVLIDCIVTSLSSLDSALRGSSTMSPPQRALLRSLSLDTVPGQWAALGPKPALSLRAWVADLQRRIEQLNAVVASGCEVPRSTWLGGLLNPAAFVAAVRLEAAKKGGVPVEELEVQVEVTKRCVGDPSRSRSHTRARPLTYVSPRCRAPGGIDQPAREGAYAHGFYLDGGRWDVAAGALSNPRPGEALCTLPVLHFKAVRPSQFRPVSTFSCAVYPTRARGEEPLLHLLLRTKAKPEKWVLSGVAVVLDAGV